MVGGVAGVLPGRLLGWHRDLVFLKLLTNDQPEFSRRLNSETSISDNERLCVIAHMRDMLYLTCRTDGLLLAPVQAKVEIRRASFEISRSP